MPTPRVHTLCLVVPCFNEEAVLPAFYQRAAAVADALLLRGIQTSVVFVDDASGDATWAILSGLALKDARVRALRLARNRGHQVAVTAGLDHADADATVILDADLQDPPEVIERMLTLIDEGFDVVHAQRTRRPGETAFKLATARLFYVLLRRVAGVDLVENAGDFRCVTRPVVLAIREFREPHRFLRALFSAVGFRQTTLRYDRDARFAGETKYPFRKMLRLAADAMFSFSTAPLRAIVWTSLSLWAMSLVYLAYSLVAHFVYDRTMQGWTSIILLLTVFTGMILMSIAVVGAYVGRIFEQGQHRPLYWLADACNMPSTTSARTREAMLSHAILSEAARVPHEAPPRERIIEPKPLTMHEPLPHHEPTTTGTP